MTRALVAVAWLVITGSVALATFSATAPEGEVREPDFERTGDVLLEVEAPPLVRSGPDGGLLLAEPSAGSILRIRPDGEPAERPVAEVGLAEETGRVLGLLADGQGRIFASWINPEGALVMARVSQPRARIWQGPQVGPSAIGGVIALLPRDRILVAVGDLGEPGLVDEEGVPNGKLLSLHPTGDPTQRPRVLGSGLSDPTAVAVDESGVIWVADNVPGDDPQPLIGVAPDGRSTTVATLPTDAVASDLALLGDHLYACLSTGMLVRYRLDDLDGSADPEPVASDCALSVTPHGEEDLAYTSEDAVRTIRP